MERDLPSAPGLAQRGQAVADPSRPRPSRSVSRMSWGPLSAGSGQGRPGTGHGAPPEVRWGGA
eukprot:5190663-Alexandrium_andersonii.AAC.1